MERVQDQSSGLSRLDIDTVLAAMVKAGQTLDHQKRQFRDGLDEFKVALGLSPRAAVILDRKAIAGFQEVFDSVAIWEGHADRDLRRLTQVIEQLPELGDVDLWTGSRSWAAIDVNPDRWEEVLTKAARLALREAGRRGQSRGSRRSAVPCSSSRLGAESVIWSKCVAPTRTPDAVMHWPYVSRIRRSSDCNRHLRMELLNDRSCSSASSNKSPASRRAKISWLSCGPRSALNGWRFVETSRVALR